MPRWVTWPLRFALFLLGLLFMSTLLSDNFTAADTTTLSGRTMSPGPGTWTVTAGTWSILSNEAIQTGVAGWSPVHGDSGSGNVVVTVTWKTPVAGTQWNGGLTLRFADVNNQWRVVLDSAAALWYLREITAGVATTRASTAFTVNSNSTYVLEATCNGNSITCTVNGANSISYGSASAGAANTKHGLANYGDVSYTGGSWDGFIVTDIPGHPAIRRFSQCGPAFRPVEIGRDRGSVTMARLRLPTPAETIKYRRRAA